MGGLALLRMFIQRFQVRRGTGLSTSPTRLMRWLTAVAVPASPSTAPRFHQLPHGLAGHIPGSRPSHSPSREGEASQRSLYSAAKQLRSLRIRSRFSTRGPECGTVFAPFRDNPDFGVLEGPSGSAFSPQARPRRHSSSSCSSELSQTRSRQPRSPFKSARVCPLASPPSDARGATARD